MATVRQKRRKEEGDSEWERKISANKNERERKKETRKTNKKKREDGRKKKAWILMREKRNREREKIMKESEKKNKSKLHLMIQFLEWPSFQIHLNILSLFKKKRLKVHGFWIFHP